MTKQQPIIQLRHVRKTYSTGSGGFTALNDINLDIFPGEFLGIVGKSGAGKTTLLNMISGVSEISAGEVLFQREEAAMPLHMMSEDELAQWRGHNLGIVYQSFELLPMLDLVNNVMLPQDFSGLYQPAISRERALELLDIVEIKEHAYKLPAHISGGQKQRVAIARALVNDPPIIVADEPTGNLDTNTAATIFHIFEKLVAQGKTVIMVTHDSNLGRRFSRRLQIVDGELLDGDGQKAMAVTTTTAPLTTPQHTSENGNSNGRTATTYRGRADQQVYDTSKPAILLNEVVKTYENAAGKFTALKGIDLSLNYGQFVSIVGKSGSGKSTLLNMLTGIDHPTSGEVMVGGQHIYQMSESKRALWRGRNVGIVFQFFQLLPTLTLLENTILPMDYCNVHPVSERPSRALELLKMVGLEEQAYDLPGAVSNGQQQSAAIARSLATDPPIIVADEPTGNLDSRSANIIIDVFQELASRGKTILIVTHDPSLTSRTDQTVIISDGELVDRTIARALSFLDHPLMLQATKRAERRTFAPGATIVRQGEPVPHFFMIAEGEVDIVVQNPAGEQVEVARLGRRQFFGEMELLNGDGRSQATAQVSANSPAELLLLQPEFFHKLLKESPTALRTLHDIAQQRQTENKTHQGTPL